MTLTCAKCHQPLPVHHFPNAIPERQAVFTVRDGMRLCVAGCQVAPADDDEVDVTAHAPVGADQGD